MGWYTSVHVTILKFNSLMLLEVVFGLGGRCLFEVRVKPRQYAVIEVRGRGIDSHLNIKCELFIDKSRREQTSNSLVAIMLIVCASEVHLSRLTWNRFFSFRASDEL